MTTKIITKQQWELLKRETWNTSMAIVETARIITENIDSLTYHMGVLPIICTGLYTHAIEEYGKFLYLQSLIPNNDNVIIQYDRKDRVEEDWKFTNHRYKFSLALQNLPDECKIVHDGDFGGNFGQNFDIDTVPAWETRLNIFNTDFYDNGNVVKYPIVDKEKLKIAVFEFKNVLLCCHMPEPERKT